jgi:beta-mannosidase
MKIAIDAHRLNKGHCWGTLYWQLNDCWPGPSWSSRDVYGRKKLLHEQLPTLFAPIALIPKITENYIEIWLVNDVPWSESINVQFVLTDKNSNIINQGEESLITTKNELRKLWKLGLKEVQSDSTLLTLTVTNDVNEAVYVRSEWY